MNIKFTPNTLKKLEQLFMEGKYKVRFEKGRFHSGHCLLEDKKVVVINKFLDLEGRIQALIEILPSLIIEEEKLSDDISKFYKKIMDNSQENSNSVQTEMNL